MDRNGLGGTVTELSDADVFGAPPPQKELSDADVMSAPAGGISAAAAPLVKQGPVGRIMDAFGQGFREASGPEPLGLSADSKKWLAKIGIFAPEGQSKYENPFHAFNEGIIVPAAAALDGAIRTANGTYRGLQSAGIEAGLHRDIVSLPDAFMGSPHALGEIKMRSGLPKDRPVLPQSAVETPSAIAGFDAYHGSPHSFDAFSHDKIGTGEGAASYGHGLYFAENASVAKDYQRALGGENGNLYQVRIDTNPERMLDWDKPLSEQPEIAEAFTRVTPKPGWLARQIEGLAVIRHEMATDPKSTGEKAYGALARVLGSQEAASEALHDAGIPGIKYLDQGSRNAGDGTRNFVVFNENDIQITHKNGEPIPTPQDRIAQAKELGIVGPEKPPLADAPSPREAAERAIPARQPPGDKVTGEVGGAPDPWQQRFDSFVSKLEAPQDVKDLIRNAAKENGDFMPARQGDISLGHVEDLATAAGVDASEINARGLGRKLVNDNETRVAMQMMLQVTEDVKTAAREVKAGGGEDALIKLQESIMRRDLAVEQVVGLRAEWGRTGNVFQEFMTRAKEEGGLTDFLKGKGRTPQDLRDIAHTLDGLDGPGAARFLNDMRTPSAWDKFKWYWVNSLISGPVTHAKYIVANAAFAGYEAAVITPTAGVIGAARRALTGGSEGVFVGEAAARTWGIIAGVPDAMKAAISAAKTGLQTPLPGEIAQNIVPKRNKNIAYQQTPIGGVAGKIIGIPSRGASAIHSFYNFIGYRASIEAEAYRAAAKEGLSVSDDAFWQRRAALADRPTAEAMNNAIEEGYRLTYITELAPWAKKLSSFVNSTKVGQLVMPFTHIPMNILQRALEGTPAAFLDAETREALSGAKGAVKQDTAVARMVAGSAVAAWVVNQTLNDRMTGFGPTDPKERAQWMATGHAPYSIRIGDEWYSFNRFGSLGTMLGLYANLSEVIPHMKPDAEELTKAIAMTVHSTGRLMEDEVGMQGLAGLMEAINEPDRKGARFVSNFAGSLLPYSSLLRQTASASDPYMRETKSVVDGLRYYIPEARQGLLPKRDWTGMPVANAGYGGDIPAAPGVSAIIQHRSAAADPVALELQALDIKPAPPTDRIKGVKLPPKMYATYQSTAGPFTRTALEGLINQPGWHDLPIGVRQEVFKSTIRATRSAAEAAMQMRYPELIQQGVQDRTDRISGKKPTKLKDAD